VRGCASCERSKTPDSTSGELLQNLNKGTMFSKIDLKWVSIRLYLMRTVNTSLLLRSLL